jgi:hypothetical protein
MPYYGGVALKAVCACEATPAEGATLMMPAARRARKILNNMLKLFTLKYGERAERFNDSVMSHFLADKEILRWESYFFERKNEYFQTVLFDHRPTVMSQTEPIRNTEKSRDESYNLES